MQNTAYNHALLALLRLGAQLIHEDRERTLSSPMFNGGSPTSYGTVRLWVDDVGVVYLQATDSRYGTTTMSTADSDADVVERWLGIPGCPDGILGKGD
ncbi:hypothetical protein [Herbaspirillum sp.]|uniref:hypothetical protein n=1 Tax=Herbaspirillum sp. TaxID=1890675 RepID=UPI000C1033C9|nr:hypothetical protein [Herbaspirillum sp.]MBO18859.1 hypothetical protein [Herbaspirillum sp.]